MKTYNFIIPVNGVICRSIVADDAESALNILLDNREALEKLPNGHLNMLLEEVIITESNKTLN